MPTTYAIPNGRTVFDVKLYTGDGTSPKQVVTGVGFQPDFAWTKTRSIGTQHALYDAVRGAGSGKILLSDTTNAEGGSGGTSDATYGYLSAFNSDGFTTTKGSDATNYFFNNNAQTYVSWLWNAGGSNATNTAGSITSTVRANTTAGFSIVTYTGTGSNATVGHGLGVAPAMIIIKNRAISQNWPVWHKSFPSNQLYLNLTNALDTPDISSVGASTFAVDTWDGVNGSGNGMVAYCWAEIAGYSAFGKYTGNGSTNGPFIYTGFRPRWIMIKRTDDTYSWWINDSARDPLNVVGQDLAANLSQAESSDAPVQDFLSNGFKLRTSAYPGFNANGGSYIYAAFAENPFKYANAR